MLYLSAQPASDYYAWQVEVYLTNFIACGINPTQIMVVCSIEDTIPTRWRILQDTYPANFYFYKDDRNDRRYIPSIQAHILAKHFYSFPHLSKESIFYHDCDFIFTRPFDFRPYLNDDVWYFSDTISYIGAEYIKTKGEEVFLKMCELVNIDPKLVEDNQMNSGGAQKLIKNVDAQYWLDVESDSNALYNGLGSLKNNKKDGDPYAIQIWCASMWAELWNAWKRGEQVRVPKAFDFAWATCPISKWKTVNFYHNAGVVGPGHRMFYKGIYMDKLPYDDEVDIDPGRCSIYYYDWVKKTGNKTCLEKSLTL